MKNIIEICKDFGFEVPAEQHADFLKAVNGEYKTIAEFEKLTGKLETANNRAETAEEALKGFDGIDPAEIQNKLDEANRKVQEARDEARKQLEEWDFNDRISGAIKSAKGKNDKAIMALLDVDKLRSSKNQDSDISDALNNLRTEHGYLFDDNGGAPRFTEINSGAGNPARKSAGEIMAIKDRSERRAEIAKNLNLFGGK